ncbi:DUF3293 domain-containing protein [Dyella sp. 20L07]|uniref:DUF3293 domain-containing protein n=1 Tax=Dyella sp. 20L07 TaxID=3384240 RepID=UPI003D289A66
MNEALLAAYRATDYRVRLTNGGWASIRIGKPLPDAIQSFVRQRHWGFITAWNPRSQQQPRRTNRHSQRELLQAIRAQAEVNAIYPGLGVGGDNRWKEPSFFVIGPNTEVFDRLGQRFDQNAYVYGQGESPAQLRVLPAP